MTSLFQPAGDCKVKKRPEGKSPSIDMPDCRSNDKRQLSVSPSRRIKKRRTLHTSGDDKAQKHLAYKDLPTDWLMGQWKPDEERKDRDAKMLQLVYHVGNMFENAPENCLLVHACNTQGHWGAGIAKAFKQQYPKAYTAHHNFCTKEHDPTEPVPTGSAQLLAPVDGISQQWIGCLFTSAKYGKAKDKADVIVENSIASLRMLLELVSVGGEDVGEIRMCKINSGKFGVPWEKTEEALKRVVLQEGWRDTMHIWEP